jgi:hypothetical protein
MSTGDKWLPHIHAELDRQSIPLPDALIAALIHVESRGVPGLVNPKSGASGLLQVMPKTLAWYNQQNPPIPLDILRSDHGEEQIRVGLWVLGQFWHAAYNYLRKRQPTIPVEQLAEIADLFYVAGPGATREHLDQVKPATLSALEQRFPAWNALPHPKNVFALGPFNWDLKAISSWLEAKYLFRRRVEKIGALAALLVFWFASKWFGGGKSDNV